ncbi:MAG TPA: homoserine dehydrogenase, partial [Candidatus Methanoperedens sp.]
MKTIRLTIAGFGAVGQGVAGAIISKKNYLNRHGLDLRVVGIADSKGCEIDQNGIDLESAVLRKKQEGTVARVNGTAVDMIREVEHDIFVDVTPTNIEDGEPGLGNMFTAFRSGRHVITSNKGPLALHFTELKEASEDHGLLF